MSNSTIVPWSNQPYAPKVSHRSHFAEIANFIGAYLQMVYYGVIVVLFFRCMSALFNPTKQARGDIKWPLVAHTTAMFSFITISVMCNFYMQLIAYVGNREFPGAGAFHPGPLGYLRLINPEAVNIISMIPSVMNGLLADGLLLYRCHAVYAMNYWIIAFPCLMYFASFGFGVLSLFQFSHALDSFWANIFNFGVLYVSISLSLNVLLTLMIIIRLILHNRMVRNAMGAPVTISGIPQVVITILVESCAINAVGSILYLGPWSVSSYIMNYSFPIFGATQVIAPLLIILRVANRTALTSNTFTGSVSSICFGDKEESIGGDEAPQDGDCLNSADGEGGDFTEQSVGTENIIEEVSL